MIACLDVQYDNHQAAAAAMVLDSWRASLPFAQYSTLVQGIGEYEPGKFYLRELRPLLSVMDMIAESIDTLVIDAYCFLDADLSPGLGARLYESLPRHPIIIGVAKNRYRDTRHAQEVFRGGSKKPLFVTSIGLSPQDAASHIESMIGDFRIPTLLKLVDRLARDTLLQAK